MVGMKKKKSSNQLKLSDDRLKIRIFRKLRSRSATYFQFGSKMAGINVVKIDQSDCLYFLRNHITNQKRRYIQLRVTFDFTINKKQNKNKTRQCKRPSFVSSS